MAATGLRIGARPRFYPGYGTEGTNFTIAFGNTF